MEKSDNRQFLDPQVLSRITRLDLRARLIVEGFITGLHRSPYHGFAVEFATHREYVPGDETKHIDWKVWSKTDRFYVKEYEEETNLKCTILLDCSRSMRYGSGTGMTKFDYAATLAASLAHLLHRQQDAVGLVTFDTAIQQNLPPSSHPSHLKVMLHALEHTSVDNQTDVSQVFARLAEQVRKRGLIVLISDLLVDLPTLLESLRRVRHRRHEVVVFHVLHEDEMTFPFEDNIMFQGLESPVQVLTEPRALRKAYLEELAQFVRAVRNTCASRDMDYVQLSTADPLDTGLHRYLVFRQRSVRAALKHGR